MKSNSYISLLIGFSVAALLAGCDTPTLRSNCWAGPAPSARDTTPEVTRGLRMDTCP